MSILDRLRQGTPPMGNDPANRPALPTDQMVGHTPAAPDPSTVAPRVGMLPFGGSGRANFYGLPQWDEVNPKLIGERGMRLLDNMYRTDAHVRRLVLAGWSPIVAGTWTLEPYGGEDASDLDREIADAIWWMLTEWMSPNFTQHLLELGPSLLRFGFTSFEQVWGTCEYKGKKLIGPRKLLYQLPRTIWRWWQDDFGDLTHIGQILPSRPDIVIPASELVYYRLGAEGDNWMGTSLLRSAYKHWYLKDKLERLDAIGQERKAVGVPVLYHSPDISPRLLDGVEQALSSMHVSEVAYLMLPGFQMGKEPKEVGNANQWLLDVIQFDSSSGAGIRDSIEYHQKAISASFLTDFLELGHHQVGARATAEVQEDPFLSAVNGALLPPVLPPLNGLIDRIRKWNWDGADGSPTLKLTLHDEASMSEIATYVQQMVTSEVMQVDPELEDWVRERAGLPPANADVRQRRQDAQQAAMDAAAKAAEAVPLDSNGEPKGSEPPNPNAPAKPAPASARQAAPAPAKPAAKAKTLDAPQVLDVGDTVRHCTPDLSLSGPRGHVSATHVEADGAITFDVQWANGTASRRLREYRLRKLDASAEPTVKWFERLLSQDRLREAFDGCREHIEAACLPATLDAARKLAHQAANGANLATVQPPGQLTDALTAHYEDLYRLGQATVLDELAKQRRALGRQLDAPGDAAAGAATSRLARARQRGEHSARTIVGKVVERLGRDQITGLRDPAALQTAAETAAGGALRVEALSNATAMVNDGRNDAGLSAGDVIGAVYTSVMDERSCLAPDATVTTREGPKRAENITLRDELLTHTGRYVRPRAIVVSEVEEELFTIHAGASALTVTCDHAVLVASRGGFSWREAGQLAVGDLVIGEATLKNGAEVRRVDLALGQSPDLEAAGHELCGLAPIDVRTELVPVGPVGLDDEVSDLKVNDPRSDLHLSPPGKTEALEFESHNALDRSLGIAGPVAADRAVSRARLNSGPDSEADAAVGAVDRDGGAPAGLTAESTSMAAEPVAERLTAPLAADRLSTVGAPALTGAVGVAARVGSGHSEIPSTSGACLGNGRGGALALGRAVGGATFEPVGELAPAVLARRRQVAATLCEPAPRCLEATISDSSPALLGGAGLASPGPIGVALPAVNTPALHERIVMLTVDVITRQRHVGKVYDFSIPDDRTYWADGLLVHNCDNCIAADTGDVLPPDEAVALGPPNPNCEGQDRCRCALVWVLAGDGAALAATSS